jgi:hypothetical protein
LIDLLYKKAAAPKGHSRFAVSTQLCGRLLPWRIHMGLYQKDYYQQYQTYQPQGQAQSANNNGRHENGAQNDSDEIGGGIRAKRHSVRGSGGRTMTHHFTIVHLASSHGVQLLPHVNLTFIIAGQHSKVNR